MYCWGKEIGLAEAELKLLSDEGYSGSSLVGATHKSLKEDGFLGGRASLILSKRSTIEDIGETVEAQPQFILSEGDLRNLAAMASALSKKDGSIALSGARTKSQNDVLQGLSLSIDGAIWQNKPQNLPVDDAISPYNWIMVDEKYLDEDHPANRKAYMEHLNKQLHLPAMYSWYDAQLNGNLLDVDIEDEKSGFKKTLKGTTDVVVAKTQHVTNNAVRNHVATQLELKRPDNKGNHEPQVCLEHLAASVLNPNVPVLTGLSNLNQIWTFYWFGSSDDADMGVAIKKLELEKDPQKEKLAKYLLESFAEESNSNRALPEGFVDRLS